jgi:hypothetical protein
MQIFIITFEYFPTAMADHCPTQHSHIRRRLTNQPTNQPTKSDHSTMSSETDKLLPQEQMREAEMLYSHRLRSLHEGESEVEKLAAKIEHRRATVLLITFDAEVELLTRCREIALRRGYDSPNKIAREDLESLRKLFVEQECFNPLLRWWQTLLGYKTTHQYIMEALDRALHHVDQNMEDWFHYQEWICFHTKVVSKWPWMRKESANAFLVVLLFYTATPILFCEVLGDKNICGDPSTGISWLEGYYMASVTLVSRVDSAGVV